MRAAIPRQVRWPRPSPSAAPTTGTSTSATAPCSPPSCPPRATSPAPSSCRTSSRRSSPPPTPRAYRDRILAALPEGQSFTPLMTLYLTEATDPADVAAAAASGLVSAVKLYPAGATTNSASGVRDMARVMPVLERMAAIGLPLCVHGEVTDPEVDIFDREAAFIDRVLAPLRARLPALRVVMEHITTADGIDYVRGGGATIAGTHHRPPPDPQPEPPPRRRRPPALLLPADRQARAPPPRPARRGDERRHPLLPRHRQRPAPAPRQGGRVLRRRRLLRARGLALARRGLRGGRRPRPPRRLRQPPRPRPSTASPRTRTGSPSPAATPPVAVAPRIETGAGAGPRLRARPPLHWRVTD